MPQSSWRLDGHYIRATVYAKGSSQPRESVLDIDYCLRLKSGLTGPQHYLSYTNAPDNLEHPGDEHILATKLSQEPDYQLTDLGNGKLHSKKTTKWWWWSTDHESDFDVNTCLRYSDDGRVEFVHLPYVDDTAWWARALFNAIGSYSKSAQLVGSGGVVGKELEKQLNALLDLFQEWIMAKNIDNKVKDWMKGTYIDKDGKLIRRGT
ncbi:hypothetical protein B0T24DRAFT_612569 [Lasiosphaeria ovina]|uniref:Uncharacterized protein n=1 Tax=Lasiosphaeria ovina TaxID=92902 RepID=A0AAE0TSS4_9PEZI|nr:hypothetical protein B0T24DRAFT_612569 [Lasiosphaeria ovina]